MDRQAIMMLIFLAFYRAPISIDVVFYAVAAGEQDTHLSRFAISERDRLQWPRLPLALELVQ